MEMTNQRNPPPGQHDTGGPEGMAMPQITRPQLFAVTLLTLLALAAGVLLSALRGDLSMTPKGMQSDMRLGVSRPAVPSSSMTGMNMQH